MSFVKLFFSTFRDSVRIRFYFTTAGEFTTTVITARR